MDRQYFIIFFVTYYNSKFKIIVIVSMSNVKDARIFAAEQIEVPDAYPGILKNFIKEVVRK